MVEALPVMLMMLVVGLRLIACSSVLSSRLDRLTLLPSAISRVCVPAVQVRVWSSGMVVSSRRSLRSTVVSALSPLLRVMMLPVLLIVWSSAENVSVSSRRKDRSIVSLPSSLVRVRMLPAARDRAWLSRLVSVSSS